MVLPCHEEMQPLKIAITADNHLVTQSKTPERFQALADIYRQCGEEGVQLLIIAGDLFEQTMANYPEFEKVYQTSRPIDLKTVIIPGNHDHQLQGEALAGEGLVVYSEPTLRPLNDSRKILFLPYKDQQTMGEAIAPFAEELSSQRWILIGHGDWSAGQKIPDPYERGIYMPLTRPDLKSYQPEMVFLGHIHLAQQDGLVYYPGSPFPLHIGETGIRKFIILDTAKGEVEYLPVNTSLIYFDESFLVIPGEDELSSLEKDIQERITGWQLPEGWADRVQVRVRISGSSSTGRTEIQSLVESSFAPYRFYQDQPPDLDQLVFSRDQDKAEIATQIRDWVDALDWEQDPNKPDKAQILQEALRVIYQVDI